jgi:hypothetical protein
VKVLVYPNPMKTQATIIVSNIASPLVLKVYDMLGREITTMESNTNKFIFTKGNLNTGIYLLKILTLDQTLIQTQKLIIE